eukprot:COSAG01_NODE_1610_length_9742_cov_5.134709_3_plen_142_part_00
MCAYIQCGVFLCAVDLLSNGDDDEDEDGEGGSSNADGLTKTHSEPADGAAPATRTTIAKVEAYGADEIRDVLVHRRRREQEQLRAERARREARRALRCCAWSLCCPVELARDCGESVELGTHACTDYVPPPHRGGAGACDL